MNLGMFVHCGSYVENGVHKLGTYFSVKTNQRNDDLLDKLCPDCTSLLCLGYKNYKANI